MIDPLQPLFAQRFFYQDGKDAVEPIQWIGGVIVGVYLALGKALCIAQSAINVSALGC